MFVITPRERPCDHFSVTWCNQSATDFKIKTPFSINQWTYAFLVFTCINIQEKKLELASHLLKYMSFVREMHMLHGDLVGRSEGEYFR